MDTEESPIATELSIVVLCYRAENQLVSFVNNLKDLLKDNDIFNHQIVLVANYEQLENDTTPQIAVEISKRNSFIDVINKRKEGGMGWDMKTGLEMANGKYVAIIDGDGQIPIQNLITQYNIIKNSDFDIITTFRTMRYDGWWRTLISKVFNQLFNHLFKMGYPVKDINAKPKMIKSSALHQMKLKSDDWFIDAEIILEAKRLKLKIDQIPTVFYKNQYRRSFVNFFTCVEFIFNLLKYKFLY
jgi:glycosyltransferase involved in cell wall biosynthesis